MLFVVRNEHFIFLFDYRLNAKNWFHDIFATYLYLDTSTNTTSFKLLVIFEKLFKVDISITSFQLQYLSYVQF